MVQRLSVWVSVVLLISVSLASAGERTSFGEGVSLESAIKITALMTNPDEYVGKVIRVDGVVTGVCKKRGCWMHVSDPESGKGIRIKVEDGAIVFPYSLMGKSVAAQGVFEAVKLTPEQAATMKAQYEAEQAACAKAETAAEQQGEGCARERSAAGEQPRTGCAPEVHGQFVYLLRGTGAEVHS